MELEVDEEIGAERYQRTEERKTYRNGWSCPALMDSLLLGRRNQNKSTVQAPKPPIPCDTRTPSAPAYVGFPCSTPW